MKRSDSFSCNAQLSSPHWCTPVGTSWRISPLTATRWVLSTRTALVILATNAFQNQQVYSDYYQWRQYLSKFFILFFCNRKRNLSTRVYAEIMRGKLWLFCLLIKRSSSYVKILHYIQYPLHKMDYCHSTWYEKTYVAEKKSKISFP